MTAPSATELGVLPWQVTRRHACPYCGDPLRSLLSGCDRASCIRRDIADEKALDLRIEASQ